MNTIEYILKRLEEFEIKKIFCVPNSYNLNIINVVKSTPEINLINCTNELNAGYAADGYARISGYGAIVTSYGDGELAAINAIAGSMAENVPVINIVGIPSEKYIHSKTLLHHNLLNVDYNSFIDAYRSVTLGCICLNIDNAKIEIDRIFKIFKKEKKPVYIAIPEDIAMMEILDKDVTYDWISDTNNLKNAAEKIAILIKEAKKPIIIGDILVRRYNSEVQYKNFCEKSGIPVTNFIMGEGIVDNSIENYLGCYFSNFANKKIKQYVDESDCVIAVGTINSYLNSFNFNNSKEIKKDIAIYGSYVYINEQKFDNVKMSDVLEEITKLIEHKNFEIEKDDTGYEYLEPQNVPMNYKFFFSSLQEFFKDNDILFVENSSLTYGISSIKLPNKINIQSQMLWCSAGWATSAILGACNAKPESRVILLTDSNSHLKSCIELGTVLKYGYKPIIIVVNNMNTTCENNQDDFSFNYTKFARIFDGEIWAAKVATEVDFDKALKVTKIMNKLCYIEVIVEQDSLIKFVQDIIDYSQLKNNDVIENSIDKNGYKSILTNRAGSIGYETTVHKAFRDIDKLFNTEVSYE